MDGSDDDFLNDEAPDLGKRDGAKNSDDEWDSMDHFKNSSKADIEDDTEIQFRELVKGPHVSLHTRIEHTEEVRIDSSDSIELER